ncbi:MAG: Hsp20/alpha crystallin family protein [Planctomycetia bacterium]|nr:Hsp20/alpha crystallin family protein [Planctomycetia bacterium]
MVTMGSTAGTTPVSAAVDAGAALTYQPHVDVRVEQGDVVVVADMPGARTDAIDVSFADGVLSLHARVAARDLPGTALRQEYGIGDFRRSFRLGDGFDATGITATYSLGVLTVRVPKLAAVRPRKVPVQAS